MKFFISSMEQLEKKIENLCNENTLLKQEVKSLKTGVDFKAKGLRQREIQERWGRENLLEEDIKLIEQKHQQLEEKMLLEISSTYYL